MTSSDLPRNRSGRLLSQSQFLPKPISNTTPASCSLCVFLSPFLLLQAFIHFHLKNCCNGASTRRESHKGKEGVTARAWQLLSNRHGRLFNWCAFGNDLKYWAWQLSYLLQYGSPSKGQSVNICLWVLDSNWEPDTQELGFAIARFLNL